MPIRSTVEAAIGRIRWLLNSTHQILSKWVKSCNHPIFPSGSLNTRQCLAPALLIGLVLAFIAVMWIKPLPWITAISNLIPKQIQFQFFYHFFLHFYTYNWNWFLILNLFLSCNQLRSVSGILELVLYQSDLKKLQF